MKSPTDIISTPSTASIFGGRLSALLMHGVHLGEITGCGTLEAWDVIVLGDGPAALRSAAEAAKQGATTLVLSVNALGSANISLKTGLQHHFKNRIIVAIVKIRFVQVRT